MRSVWISLQSLVSDGQLMERQKDELLEKYETDLRHLNMIHRQRKFCYGTRITSIYILREKRPSGIFGFARLIELGSKKFLFSLRSLRQFLPDSCFVLPLSPLSEVVMQKLNGLGF